jgi:predicted deacylase
VWLTVCAHGDEVRGIALIQEAFRSIRRRLLKGAFMAFPMMNPLGFETRSCQITMSGECDELRGGDLGERSAPGRRGSS